MRVFAPYSFNVHLSYLIIISVFLLSLITRAKGCI